jgi:hypothetical protein
MPNCCKNLCQHFEGKGRKPTAKGLLTADPKELNSATCLCCMQYKSGVYFIFSLIAHLHKQDFSGAAYKHFLGS